MCKVKIMTKVISKKYVEARLTHWAEWYSKDDPFGLSYPNCSMEYRLQREGHIEKGPHTRGIRVNEAADEIEDLVREMADYNLRLAEALRAYYFTQGSLRRKVTQLKHLDIARSHTFFKYHVDMAHVWIAGRLSTLPKKFI
jgi:hypothetical protein